MNRSRRGRLFALTVTLFSFVSTFPSAATADELLQAGDGLKWCRGNMHTHSHWSDGDDYLEMIALWYRNHDYQFLVFTDHNVLANTQRWVEVKKTKGGRTAYDKLKTQFPNWVEERKGTRGQLEVRLRTFDEVSKKLAVPKKFLLVQGEEISDSFGRAPIHLNISNVVELIPPMKGNSIADTIQNNVRAAIIQREKTGQPMLVHLNHPNFGFAITAEDLMLVRGEKFFEVYNGHPDVYNHGDHHHAGTERIWDILLTRRLAEFQLPMMYGLATDDGHNYHNLPNRASNPGRGWVMVLTKDLQAKAIIEAMEAGRYYSSSGVSLKQIKSSDRGLTLEVDPVAGETYTIDFIGTRKGYDPKSEPVKDKEGKEIRATRIYSKDIGQTLKTVIGNKATYQFTGDEIYVRARVTSSGHHPNPAKLYDHKQAWVQPVLGPAVEKEKGTK